MGKANRAVAYSQGQYSRGQYTQGLYTLYRALLGAYLSVHFGYLAVYAKEIFSNAGMLADSGHSPLFAFAPSLLHISDSPGFVVALTLSGVVAALAFAWGRCHRLSAAWMLLLLISLFARNPLIANPALPYVGFMLLAHLFVPTAPRRDVAEAGPWRFPPEIFAALTIVLCLSYSYSGYTKLLSPSWVSGDTVALVLQNPLARDWLVRDVVLLVPEAVLQGLTWLILYVELLFAPLFVVRRLRPWLWGAMLVVQVGFLVLLRFPDLTIPMLLFHLLTFDARWIPARPLRGAVLHYDGECGVCHRAVRFALTEVPDSGLRFRPLQLDEADVGSVTSWRLEQAAEAAELGDDCVFLKTAAVIRLLEASGGLWRAMAVALKRVPLAFRDAGYDALAHCRRRLAAKPATLCPLGGPRTMARFILEP